jgi:hypothetical protein
MQVELDFRSGVGVWPLHLESPQGERLKFSRWFSTSIDKVDVLWCLCGQRTTYTEKPQEEK